MLAVSKDTERFMNPDFLQILMEEVGLLYLDYSLESKLVYL